MFHSWNAKHSLAKAVETPPYVPSGRLLIGMDLTPPFGGLAASMAAKAGGI
jgi:hypothetical protein